MAEARCCNEPGCRRKQPMSLMKSPFSGTWCVVTRSRPYREGTPTQIAMERHELPIQSQVQLDQMHADSAWLRGLLAATEMTKEQLAAHLEVEFPDA